MLELAVELGSSQLVQTLLEAGASVIPVKGALPPLFLAVLHRHRTNVQLLLDAQADPWQEIAIASVLCHSLQWHGHAARKEVFNATTIQQRYRSGEEREIFAGPSEAHSFDREGRHYHEANYLEISTYHRKAQSKSWSQIGRIDALLG